MRWGEEKKSQSTEPGAAENGAKIPRQPAIRNSDAAYEQSTIFKQRASRGARYVEIDSRVPAQEAQIPLRAPQMRRW